MVMIFIVAKSVNPFSKRLKQSHEDVCVCVCVLVEGGQRAIIFNRIGGMQMNTVLAEGLHFRYRSRV